MKTSDIEYYILSGRELSKKNPSKIQQKFFFSVYEAINECVLHNCMRCTEMLAVHKSFWNYCVAGLGCCKIRIGNVLISDILCISNPFCTVKLMAAYIVVVFSPVYGHQLLLVLQPGWMSSQK